MLELLETCLRYRVGVKILASDLVILEIFLALTSIIKHNAKYSEFYST